MLRAHPRNLGSQEDVPAGATYGRWLRTVTRARAACSAAVTAVRHGKINSRSDDVRRAYTLVYRGEAWNSCSRATTARRPRKEHLRTRRKRRQRGRRRRTTNIDDNDDEETRSWTSRTFSETSASTSRADDSVSDARRSTVRAPRDMRDNRLL